MISRLLNIIENFFFAGRKNTYQADVRKRIFLTSTFSLVGCLLMLIFGLLAVHDRNIPLAIIVLTTSFIGGLNYLYLRRTGNFSTSNLIIILLMALLTLYLLGTGGKNNTGPLWLYIMPLLIFYVMGLRSGSIALIILILSILLILFLPGNILLRTNYPTFFTLRFLGSLLAVSVMAFGYEYMREEGQRELQAEIDNRRRIEEQLSETVTDLESALAEVKTLSGMLPICSHCKKIRDDNGYWNQLESYITRHSGASFSHGLCEECSEKLYGDQAWYGKKKG